VNRKEQPTMTTHTFATSASEYLEKTRDANKQRELHPADLGRIDLDAFAKITSAGRRLVWSVASDDDKRGLIVQILRSQNVGPDEATIAMYLQILDLKLALDAVPISPEVPVELVQETATELAHAAHCAGDRRAENALNKFAWHYANGVRPSLVPGGMLVPSANTAGQVYRVSDVHGCSCAAAENQIICWHAAALETLHVAMDRYADALSAADVALERLVA
jgi:hypothetical protein